MQAGASIYINLDDKDEHDIIAMGQTIATLSVQDVESGVTSDVDLVATIIGSEIEAQDEDSLWHFNGLHAGGQQGRLVYTGSPTAPVEVILKSVDFYW